MHSVIKQRGSRRFSVEKYLTNLRHEDVDPFILECFEHIFRFSNASSRLNKNVRLN